MTNNDIMKKLRVALSFRDTDVIDCLKLSNYEITKSELSLWWVTLTVKLCR